MLKTKESVFDRIEQTYQLIIQERSNFFIKLGGIWLILGLIQVLGIIGILLAFMIEFVNNINNGNLGNDLYLIIIFVFYIFIFLLFIYSVYGIKESIKIKYMIDFDNGIDNPIGFYLKYGFKKLRNYFVIEFYKINYIFVIPILILLIATLIMYILKDYVGLLVLIIFLLLLFTPTYIVYYLLNTYFSFYHSLYIEKYSFKSFQKGFEITKGEKLRIFGNILMLYFLIALLNLIPTFISKMLFFARAFLMNKNIDIESISSFSDIYGNYDMIGGVFIIFFITSLLYVFWSILINAIEMIFKYLLYKKIRQIDCCVEEE